MCNRYVGLCRECVPVQVVVKVEQTVPWGSLTRHVTCMGDGRWTKLFPPFYLRRDIKSRRYRFCARDSLLKRRSLIYITRLSVFTLKQDARSTYSKPRRHLKGQLEWSLYFFVRFKLPGIRLRFISHIIHLVRFGLSGIVRTPADINNSHQTRWTQTKDIGAQITLWR